jgi:hypothetical protein
MRKLCGRRAATGWVRILQRKQEDPRPIDEKRELGEKDSNKKGEKGEKSEQ